MRTLIIIFSLLLVISIYCNGQKQTHLLNKGNHINKSEYSNNPGICEDTCFGDFNNLGTKRTRNTLNIYISGHNVDLMKDCCQWIFGEIVYNDDPGDHTLDTLKTHLIDLEVFSIPKDSSEYGNEDVKKKVMCICIRTLGETGTIRIIADPYHYGFYKRPKDWGNE